MGLRFRKSIKICKGVKVNLSKSGLSLSLGGKGYTCNLSNRGVRHTLGLPGTGLSYSTSSKDLNPFNKNKKEINKVSSKSSYGFKVSNGGIVNIVDENGNVVTDGPIIKKIKSTDEYKKFVAGLDMQKEEKVDEKVLNSKEENDEFINIVSKSVIVRSKEDYEEEINDDNLTKEEREFLIDKKNGEEEAICDEFDAFIGEIELPIEININYDWYYNLRKMSLDVDMPEIEDLPKSILIKTDSGIKEKRKTQTELKEEYLRVVFGIALFLSSHVFNLSPSIEEIVISAYTQRRNKIGDEIDVYIYSIIFNRKQFEHIDVSKVEPVKFCLDSKSRINISSTGLLKEIVPFE